MSLSVLWGRLDCYGFISFEDYVDYAGTGHPYVSALKRNYVCLETSALLLQVSKVWPGLGNQKSLQWPMFSTQLLQCF